MVAHDFIVKDKKKMLKYKLTFDKNYYEIITLHAPSLFNIFSGMYLVLPEAIHACRSLTSAPEPEPELPLDPYRQSIYQWDPEEIANQWHPEDTPPYTRKGSFEPWPWTNLGQNPMLGGVCISH